MGWDGPFFLCLFIFKMISSIKLKLVSFFVARSLPYRLPSGSSANLTIEADRPSLVGWMGWDGMDGTVIKMVL